jgi:hypothetical protein
MSQKGRFHKPKSHAKAQRRKGEDRRNSRKKAQKAQKVKGNQIRGIAIVGSSPALEVDPALAIFAPLFFAIFAFLCGYSGSEARHRRFSLPSFFAPFAPFCGYSFWLSLCVLA